MGGVPALIDLIGLITSTDFNYPISLLIQNLSRFPALLASFLHVGSSKNSMSASNNLLTLLLSQRHRLLLNNDQSALAMTKKNEKQFLYNYSIL